MNIYPQHLAEQLDFPLVAQWISQLCSNPAAKERALALAPLPNFRQLEEERERSDEITAAVEREGNFPGAAYEPIGGALGKLALSGNFLELEEFAAIRSAVKVYHDLYRHGQLQQDRLPLLHHYLRQQPTEEGILQLINQRLDEHGKLKPNASPELARILSQLAQARVAAQRIFARVLKKFRQKGILADFEESISEDRPVMAIQASYKNQVQGILHGSSARHSISFIEPGETVEVNNRVAQLRQDEKQEIRRILLSLTADLRPWQEWLQAATRKLDDIDFWRAKALFAQREKACYPSLDREARPSWRRAVNPVLRYYNRKNGKNTVPLDLDLYDQSRIVVISGPNAGGKSLALKTVGLLQYMTQCGLPVPVDHRSKLSYFEDLFGDIGDAQSIENELSTYSSKLQKMQYFLKHAQQGSLLLLDEFGSGSDPDLGSALAQVCLEKLSQYGVTAVCTTHFHAIKALAAHLPGVSNAAMLFDQQHFTPQYILEVGSPGSSYTFEVARQSAIPNSIIEAAKERLNGATRELDQLLAEVQTEKDRLRKQGIAQSKELEELRQLQQQQKHTISKLEAKLTKSTRLNEQHNRILYWGERFQKLVEAWLQQKNQKDKKQVVARFIGLLNQRAGELTAHEQKDHQKQVKNHNKKLQKHLEEPLKPGDEVRLLDNKVTGKLLEIKGETYLVALGGSMTAHLQRRQIVKASADIGEKPRPKKRPKKFQPPPAQKGDAPSSTTKNSQKKKLPRDGAKP